MNYEQVKSSIETLVEKAGFSFPSQEFSFDEKTNTYWLSLPFEGTRLLVSRDGEALSALNHLAAKIVERLYEPAGLDLKARPRIVIDAGNVQRKKIDSLRTVAHMMAERARYFKSSVSVDPMPPHERRIVHEFLSEMPDITTESEGAGKDRHIVIKYRDPSI